MHSNIDSYIDDVEELKKEWILEILEELGVDPDEYGDGLNNLLRSIDVEIETYPSFGGVLVKYENEIIAEWGGPELTLKKDKDESLYYEININYIKYNIEDS